MGDRELKDHIYGVLGSLGIRKRDYLGHLGMAQEALRQDCIGFGGGPRWQVGSRPGSIRRLGTGRFPSVCMWIYIYILADIYLYAHIYKQTSSFKQHTCMYIYIYTYT